MKEENRASWRYMVLKFGKALTQRPIEDKDERPEPNYITLGYYDSLRLEPLPLKKGETWLSGVYAYDGALSDALDGSSFLRPVHCAVCREAVEAADEFMKRSEPYLFVTLLQSRTEDGGVDPAAWEEAVFSHLRRYVGEYLAKSPGEVSWLPCRAPTLSDLVILWKSASIPAVMEAIQGLYRAPMVGDQYSIPAIRRDSILKKPDAPEIREEPLYQVGIRYLVRNTKEAYDFFADLWNPDDMPCFTVGVEDLTYVGYEWTTLELRDMLCRRLVDGKYQKRFQRAFVECETHLGEEMRLEPGVDDDPVPSPLDARCAELLKRYRELREERGWARDLNRAWVKAANELFSALADLGQSMTADGFCYLVLDAAGLFLKIMSQMEEEIKSEQLGQIQRFLRGWSNLMEQVLRTDGKFSQQTGFSPPSICEIPSSLLEFYLAFMIRAGRLMQSAAGDRERFSVLLVPKLCRRVKVTSIFQRDPPCDRLLYVDIPIYMLYEPRLLLCQMTHEIAHFAGSSWRDRKNRKSRYIDICTQELAAELLFEREKTLEDIQKSLSQGSATAELYLEPLSKELRECLKELLDGETPEAWIKMEYGEDMASQSDRLSREMGILQSNAQLQGMRRALFDKPYNPVGQYFSRVKDMEDFLQECYADTAMIFLLDLSPREYMEQGVREWEFYALRSSEVPGRDAYYWQVERWAAVLYALFPGESVPLQEETSETMKNFARDVECCTNFLYTHREKLTEKELKDCETHYHRPETMSLLNDYLRSCHEKMKDYLDSCHEEKKGKKGEVPIEELRAAFRSMVTDNDVWSESCRKLRSQYRRLLLTER